MFFEQAGLGLPDESYYREEKFAEIRTKYVEYLTTILGLAGLDRPGRAREAHLRARDRPREEPLGQRALPRQRGDLQPHHLERRRARRPARRGSTSRRGSTGIDAPQNSFTEVVVRQPSFLEALPGLITAERLEAWKDWMSWQVIRSNAGYLSSEFVNANFDFYGKTLTGTPELRARWKRGVSLVEGTAGRGGRPHLCRAPLPRRAPRRPWTSWSPTSSRPTVTVDHQPRLDDAGDHGRRPSRSSTSSRPRSATR